MADVWTALIAAITGTAGLAGGMIAGRFNLKATASTHRKDNLTSLRAKFEELHSELDRVQSQSNRILSQAPSMMQNEKLDSKEIEMVDLGKIRAIVQLYFPICQMAIDRRDDKSVENVKELRENFSNNPTLSLGTHVMFEMASISAMCNEIRDCLATEAAEIGRSVRESLNTSPRAAMKVNSKSGLKRLTLALLAPYFCFWLITGWLENAALPNYLAESSAANKRGDWESAAMWMQQANEASEGFKFSLIFGLAAPSIALIIAAITYWVYRGFRQER